MINEHFGRWTVIAKAADTFQQREVKGPLKITNYLCRCDCGTERVVAMSRLKNGRSKSCGCLRKDQLRANCGEKAANWKGGIARWLTPQGYICCEVYGRPGRIMEHRLVMEQHLGRPLEDDETVHHINGDRADNRLENLELWCKRHPSGQRVADLLEWAEEIIRRYYNK